MSFLTLPFSRPQNGSGGGAWFPVGPASSYPNVDGTGRISSPQLCSGGGRYLPGCRVFHVPRGDSAQAAEVAVDEWKDAERAGDTRDQVMVFRYNGRFVAVNHECPHSSYPLSNGTPFDIEDFGVVLSSGITCPKHEWSFDLHTGKADRGSYKLQVWEVQQRPSETEDEGMDIWVRRKQKIG